MTYFENAIEKLLRRIKRAAQKNKWGKVNRLTTQLNDLYELQEQAEQHEEEQEQQQEQTNGSGSNSGSVGGSNDEDGPLAEEQEREDIDVYEEMVEEQEEE